MMAIRTIAVLVGLLAFSATSIAGDAVRRGAPKGITDAFYGCMDQAAGDIVGLGGCTTAEKKVQDARLNKAYSALMAKLDATGQGHLRAAERAWIDFNAKSVDTELDVRNSEKTANIDASINEIYRYAERANTLETLLSIVSD
jgi:uncharacterized protein YecT (DUF1311 family)